MSTFLIFVPFIIFLLVCVGGMVGMVRFVRKTKITTGMTGAGETMHMETPLGTFDVRPESKLDPRLASIPAYPGASPSQSGIAEQITEFHHRNQSTSEITASYKTSDSPQNVQEFYRRELPGWNRNLIEHRGWEVVQENPDCLRMVRVFANHDVTIIEHSIKPPNYLKKAAQRGSTE